jgi:hypothetical protein
VVGELELEFPSKKEGDGWPRGDQTTGGGRFGCGDVGHDQGSGAEEESEPGQRACGLAGATPDQHRHRGGHDQAINRDGEQDGSPSLSCELSELTLVVVAGYGGDEGHRENGKGRDPPATPKVGPRADRTAVIYRPRAMTQTEPSRSALNVAFARTHLTWLGVIDDPYARQMLTPKRRRVAAALQLPGLRLLGRHSSLPGLAARTLFFDRFVADALDDEIRQVVIVAAGYDSRAWRLARPGITFFEIDQPAPTAQTGESPRRRPRLRPPRRHRSQAPRDAR